MSPSLIGVAPLLKVICSNLDATILNSSSVSEYLHISLIIFQFCFAFSNCSQRFRIRIVAGFVALTFRIKHSSKYKKMVSIKH